MPLTVQFILCHLYINKDVYLGFEVDRCAQVPKLARAQLKMGRESGVFPQYTGFILQSSEKGTVLLKAGLRPFGEKILISCDAADWEGSAGVPGGQ